MKRPTHTRQAGFTLIELMVSIGLFAIVMTIVAGSYLMILNITQRAEGVSTAIDGVSFALDDMTRTIRTGTAYGCGLNAGVNCPYPDGLSTFTLTDQSGTEQTFSLSNGVIYQKSGGSGTNVALTDPAIDVTSLLFYLTGATPVSQGGTAPPYLTILIAGTITAGGQTIPFNVETSAAMRGINL